MITCTETGKKLTEKDTVFVATRLHDPEAHVVSFDAIKRIPKDAKTSMMHRYRTGGINIHSAQIVESNGSSEVVVNRDDGFLFSVPGYEFLKLMPKTSERFRFPGQ